mgnify:FL=1
MNRACVLEVPQLKDYGGQPLIFKGAMQTRCVTEDVFNHPVIQTYLTQLLLIEVQSTGAVSVPAAPTVKAVEVVTAEETITVVQTPEVAVVEEPVVEPIPEPIPEPVVVEELVVEPTPEPTPEPVVIEDESSVSVEELSSKDTDDGKGFEVKRRRR